MVKKRKQNGFTDIPSKTIKRNIFQQFLSSSALETLPDISDSKDFVENGRRIFDWMISPVENKMFFDDIFEKKAILIKRKQLENNEWLSTKDIDRMLRDNILQYGVNIDLTSYENGQRETHNQEGRAHAGPVWDLYHSGCSIRLLNPQTFSHKVWQKLAALQEYVGNFCGANVYLTPPGTQGFAPHWDDIEAFVIQLEGSKRWRVYEPTTILPDFSSHNLDEAGLPDPIVDCVLTAGDLLYFPRGFIHQGNALENQHSLHITVSMFQKHAYSHLMSTMLPNLMKRFESTSENVRQSLPCNFLSSMGVANAVNGSANEPDSRKEVIEKMQGFLREMIDHVPDVIDLSADEFALKFMRESLPPCLKPEETNKTVTKSGAKWNDKTKSVQSIDQIVDNETQLRLVRKHCVRLVRDKVDSKLFRLYFSVENTRVYHEVDLKSIELGLADAKNVKLLIRKYPKYCCAGDLKFGDEDSRLELMLGLYEKGILISQNPL